MENKRTILLTSEGRKIPEEILKVFPKSPEATKVGYVFTAKKGKPGEEYKEKDDLDLGMLNSLGCQVYSIDIEGKNEDELREFFNDKDVIFVRGGNSFYLLKCARESGFDKVVRDLLDQGKVYIGVSAGSYIACPTIEMANWKERVRNFVGLTDFTAMNLVPFLMSVHYKPENKEFIKKGIESTKYPVKVLNDEQAILVQGDDFKLVGKGEEIILPGLAAEGRRANTK